MKLRVVYKPGTIRFVERVPPVPESVQRIVAQVIARAIAERRAY